ncbi:MAG: beta-ketoacyl-[acyl-carrier-protein] synthase II, partial [Ignavibacteria bacterium]|nr:beta-ketoacyl-[acyl-carrier-protein] synthase II [Ignavibacteria bacterium]
MNDRRRVVVTGIGAITPIGLSAEEFWASLISGKSGAGPITYFDTSAYDTHFACLVKGFKATDFLDRKAAQRMDPFAQFAMISSDMAISDSGISAKDLD